MKARAWWLAVAAAAWICACASQNPQLKGTRVAPDSMGEVRTAAGPNNETQLTITVYNLPKPQIVANGATTYIAWAKPSGAPGEAQKLGHLSVDETDVGKLQATTPLRSFDLIVSAEQSDAAQMSGEPVLTGHVGAP